MWLQVSLHLLPWDLAMPRRALLLAFAELLLRELLQQSFRLLPSSIPSLDPFCDTVASASFRWQLEKLHVARFADAYGNGGTLHYPKIALGHAWPLF